MRLRTLALMAMLPLLTAACSAQAHAPEPVPVDRVECARCRMLVSTEAGAAQVVAGGADTRFYDDVGCLAADWAARGSDATAFVRLEAGVWIEAPRAAYARPAGARTAMGSGFVAYATAADARAADRDARAFTWDDVIAGAHP